MATKSIFKQVTITSRRGVKALLKAQTVKGKDVVFRQPVQHCNREDIRRFFDGWLQSSGDNT